MHQHWVSASYLRAWCDPASAHVQNPYVWRFSKDGSEVKAKSPEKLFRESNMYTFVDEKGLLNQTIEQGLSKLEDQFERLRRDKIMKCEPMTDDEKGTLFRFVATARFRTLKSRDHWKRQLGEAVELGDRIKAHIESLSAEEKAAALGSLPMPSGGPTISLEGLRSLAEQPLQLMLPVVTEREAEFLSDMTTTIFCTSSNPGFITSDAPVVWSDPELYKMPPFYRSLALGSPTIEVTMPISPSRMLLLTHGRAPESYFDLSVADNPVIISAIPTDLVDVLNRLSAIGTELVDDFNRRTRFHCDDHFVSNSNLKKEIWFDPGTPPAGWEDEWRKQR